MKLQWKRFTVAIALVLTVPLILGALHVVAPAPRIPEPTAFHGGDRNLTAWADDVSGGYELRSTVSGLVLLDDLPDPANTLVVIHAPTRSPAGDESRALHAHLEQGGSLWVLDAQGVYNRWLNQYGAAIGPHRVLDPGAAESKTTVALEGGANLAAFDAVLARSPATLVLDNADSWEPWLRAPATTHLDLAGNGTIDRGDPPGPHLVGAARTLASGGLLAVTSDATLLSDAMREQDGDNVDFARWAAQKALPEGGSVVIDESQQGWTAAERLPAQAVGTASFLYALPPVAAGALVVLFSALTLGVIFTARALVPYRPHERHDPARAPESHRSFPEDMVEEAAWQTLASQSKQPLNRLKKMGAQQAANGLCDDPALKNILLKKADDREIITFLRSYTGAQKKDASASDPNPKNKKGSDQNVPGGMKVGPNAQNGKN